MHADPEGRYFNRGRQKGTSMSTNEPVIEQPTVRRLSGADSDGDIQSCNFRYAGRLSHENTHSLSVLFERFAANASNALEAYLGAALRLRLKSIEQSTIQTHLADIPPDSHRTPCTLSVMETSFLMQMDLPLTLPIIDLLLGGVGDAFTSHQGLTDIDEEILESVSELFLHEIESLWLALDLSYQLGHCIRPAAVASLFSTNEKVVILLFEMEIAGVVGSFRVVLPTSFVGYMVRHLNAAQSTSLSGRGETQRLSLRDRILDCEFYLATDVTQMRVLVRDLIALEPGQVLRMHAPVSNAGRLTVENKEIFHAVPVRSGTCKAAQVTTPIKEHFKVQ